MHAADDITWTLAELSTSSAQLYRTQSFPEATHTSSSAVGVVCTQALGPGIGKILPMKGLSPSNVRNDKE